MKFRRKINRKLSIGVNNKTSRVDIPPARLIIRTKKMEKKYIIHNPSTGMYATSPENDAYDIERDSTDEVLDAALFNSEEDALAFLTDQVGDRKTIYLYAIGAIYKNS
jgi:hypothetical protein